jgi:hypothetical protein
MVMTFVPTTNVHERIEKDRRVSQPERTRWQTVKNFRLYARGRQRGTLNADQIRLLEGVTGNPFCDNVCSLILDEHAGRLRLARFDVENNEVSDYLFDMWVKNSFPKLAADNNRATFRDGNHCIALDWEPDDDPGNPYGGRVVLARERFWNGTDGMFVMYADGGDMMYAVKEWTSLDTGERRRNVYFDDYFQRFVFRGGAWVTYTLDGDDALFMAQPNGAIGLPWLKRDGSPLHIPVVHFTQGSDDDTFYGFSLLDGGVLGFQDQINAIQQDMTAAAMLNGSPQTTSKGFALPIDPDTNAPVAIRTGPGKHHHNEEVTAEWGTIPPGSLAELETAYLSKSKAVMRMTKTPYHIISGEWPSGNALYRADLPIVNATKERVDGMGPKYSTVAHRSVELANAFGTASLDETALIRALFESPEQRDDLGKWEIVEKAAPFVSEEESLRLAGYPPDKIEQILKEREAAADARAERAAVTFSRGPLLPGVDGIEDEDIGESDIEDIPPDFQA